MSRLRLQLLWSWSPRCWRFGAERLTGNWRLVYAWWAQIGPLEIRRWAA